MHAAHHAATCVSTGNGQRQGKDEEQEEQGATEEDKWDHWIALLELYKHEYGHVCVPQNHKFANGDGAFFLSQIRVRRASRYCPHMLTCSHALDSPSRHLLIAHTSQMRCCILTTSRAGKSVVPLVTLCPSTSTRRWKQVLDKKGKIPGDRRRRLKELGFVWDGAEASSIRKQVPSACRVDCEFKLADYCAVHRVET